MLKLGFGRKWVDIIMHYISFVSYSVLVNGQSGEVFYPTRGIRQGDPLSPYIFLLYTKEVSSHVNHFDATRLIHGLTITRGDLSLNHLLFVES